MIFAIVTLAAWLIGCLVLPIGRWVDDLDANGRNWPGYFVVKRDLDVPKAVWAQEYYEAQIKWRLLPITIVGSLIGKIHPALAYWTRWLELMGHEVEVQTEVRIKSINPKMARERESRALVNGYKSFEGWTKKKAYNAMEKRAKRARRWVDEHWSEINGSED